MKERESKTCYLCGKTLSRKRNRDHVPPKQFFPRAIRKKYHVNLDWLYVHPRCNSSYQHDEDYFVFTLGGTADGSYVGNLLWRDIKKSASRKQGQTLIKKVLREFDPRPGGIILPPGQIAKRFDGDRVWRIAWKIVRGLYFLEHTLVLPASKPYAALEFQWNAPLTHRFGQIVLRETPRGKYAKVFDYKIHTADVGKIKGEIWALLFWERLTFLLFFHSPGCSCDECYS